MKIKALELFRYGRDTFQADQSYDVPDEVGAYCCMAGWAVDVSGEIPTRPRKNNQHVTLEVNNNYTSGALVKAIADAALSPHISDIKRGEKIIAGAKKGHAATYGTKAEKDAKREAYQKTFEQIKHDNPHLSRTRIADIIGKKYDVSGKTILRNLPNPEKK